MEGKPFGRYRLVELLGRGGMGEVWRAHDTVIDRVVALKVLPANFADDQVYQERFRREAHAAAGLNEPHVIPIHDFGEIDGRLYVTMRLIEGRDLGGILAEGPLEPARAIRIIEQIGSALDAAHRIGLVHRDVKPSNILITVDDFAYLIDFGIARAAGETGLTSTGATVGTWAYMAPERFRKGTADARADVYSLACVLYQSLTGQVPFPGETLEQIAVSHMFQPTPQPSMVQDGVPAAMDQVIAMGMAKEPDQRYATTKDLAQAARAALTTPTRGDSTLSGSSAIADAEPGTSSPETAAEATGAQGLPSRHAPEAPIDSSPNTRTQAGPTVSASDAPTQQAPLSAGNARPLAAPSTKSAVLQPLSQRLNRRTKILVGAVAAVAVAVVAVVIIVGSQSSSNGGIASQTLTTTTTSTSAQASGPHQTLGDYLKENNIQEWAISRGTPAHRSST